MDIGRSSMRVPAKRLVRPRVVVADDDKYFRSVVVKAIEHADGQTVGEAADGNEALQLCRSLKPDWLFTDYEMPGLNGLELVQCLVDEGVASKVVVISHSLNEALEDSFRELRVDYFFCKRGFVINEFIECLKRNFSRSE